MRVIYFSFIMNSLALALKAVSLINSSSAAVDAEFLHALGDFVGSGLLAVGVLIMYKKPTIKYPFGFGRGIYVFGLISAAIVGGFLFALSFIQGVNQLGGSIQMSSSPTSIAALVVAAMVDSFVLLWAVREYRFSREDPSVKGTVVENLTDLVGDLTALMALVTLNTKFDAYGALTISGILLISSISLGHKYFNVLIGASAPRNVVGRAIKVAVSLPYVVDVNDVKSLVLGPSEYLIIMQVEIPSELNAERIEELREELKEKLMRAEPSIKYLIVEFVTPKAPPHSFKKLLKEIIRL